MTGGVNWNCETRTDFRSAAFTAMVCLLAVTELSMSTTSRSGSLSRNVLAVFAPSISTATPALVRTTPTLRIVTGEDADSLFGTGLAGTLAVGLGAGAGAGFAAAV